MSNHYYADGANHYDHHQEQNINGSLTTAQVEHIVKGFFADETEEEASIHEPKEETSIHEPKEETDSLQVIAPETKEKEIFHFVHPALEDHEAWQVHREVKRLVNRFDIQDICERLSQLKKENKVLLPQSVKNALTELKRMGMPADKPGYDYKTFAKYYNKN